jgi:hypothetical protein
MKKLLIASLLTLASLHSFAQKIPVGNLNGLRCHVPALKSQNEDVKLRMREMMIETKVEVMRKLGSLLVEVDSNQIKITKKERGFPNNFDSKVTGTATLKDGTIITIEGNIQYDAKKQKRYDRVGNELSPTCAFRAFSNAILVNSRSGLYLDSLNIRPVKLDLTND